jgi:predicted dehydrogenase
MEEFLGMVSFGTVKTSHLTTHKFPFDKSLTAYEMMLTGKEQAIGVILQYPEKTLEISGEPKRIDAGTVRGKVAGKVGVGLIGAGLFARGTLLPALKKIPDLALVGVATSRGLSASAVAKSDDFQYAASDYKEILKDESVKLVFILTRHNSHARFVCEALREGKAVFVEKPLCINAEQLREIIDTYSSVVTSQSSAPFLMVGFNRRFAPITRKCIEFVGQNRKSSVVQIRCNAGFISPDSWVHKIDEGGGRIIGEVCHFIDLAQAITGGLPKRVFASGIEDPQGLRDSLTISMKMDNGAVAGITYASNGDKSFSREEVQVFAGGSVSVIDNFRNIHCVSAGKDRKEKSIEVDRGYVEEIRTTIDAIRDGKPSPIDFRSLVATTIATFAVEESITNGESVEINLREWGID